MQRRRDEGSPPVKPDPHPGSRTLAEIKAADPQGVLPDLPLFDPSPEIPTHDHEPPSPAPSLLTLVHDHPTHDLSPESPDTATKQSCELCELQLLWNRLKTHGHYRHPWLKTYVEDWTKETRGLVGLVQQGDDQALIELIQRDPRYLMFPSVIAKIFRWKLDAIASMRIAPIDRTDPTLADAGRIVNDRGAAAEASLNALGKAIAFYTEKGHHRFIDQKELLTYYQSVRNSISRAVTLIESMPKSRAGVDYDKEDSSIATQTALPLTHLPNS